MTTSSRDSSGSKCTTFLSVLLLASLWVTFAAAVAAADPGKPLRVVMDNNYPPYIFLGGDGAAKGILVDQWRLWEKRTGIPVEISVMDWESALRRMKNGEFDVIDTVFKTEERSTWLEFGRPHARIEVSVFFKNQISGITDIASLKGFVVAVKDGDAAVEGLKKAGVENLVLFKGYEDIVIAAKEHKVNVFVIDKPPALYFLYKYEIEKLFKTSIAMPSGEFHRAVGKGKQDLLATVEEGFAALSQEELRQIERKWLGTPVGHRLSTGYLLIGFGILWVLLLLFFFWNRMLRRAVRRRTAELEISRVDLAQTTELLVETGRIARIGAWEKFPDSGEERWSKITREIIGVDDAYVPTMSESIKLFVAGEGRERLVEALEVAIARGEPFDIEARLCTVAGEVRWVRCLGRAEMVDSRCRRLYGTLQDIERRKRAEAALIESEKRFRVLVKNSSDCLVILNGDGSQRYVSPGAERMTGFAVAELEGRSLETIIHRDDFAVVLAAWNEAVAHPEKTVTVRYRHLHRTRDWAHFEAIAQSFLNEPSLNGVIASVRDISEAVEAEAEKEKLQEQLTQAQKMESVGRLAGGVAHDFNNMLSVILGHTELAQRGLESAHPLFVHLQEIGRAATRSADLTRQLLAFARKQTVTPKVLALNETVEGMLKMLRRLIGEDIDLLWQPGENLWSVKIDPSQVDQMLANLCINARDAIVDTGRVTIRTVNTSFDQAYCANHLDVLAGDYVLLSVSDSGSGMDEETLSHLFEPFFTTKELGKGTGLGLATVYGIVKQNGGIVNVVSEPGQGTTFAIYLPRHQVEAHEAQIRPEASVGSSRSGTILLVEDEPMILEVTEAMLKLQGYEVLVASTPTEALRLADQRRGDIGLLMTDVVMPEMNGRDLAQRLQALSPGLKCLFMSGYTADVIAQHGVLGSDVHFIQKPFSMEEVVTKVRLAMAEAVD
jgi:PAS domain S-box-containing protein